MIHRNTHNGFAIALAWPQTYCKQPGSWYDPISEWLGITKNNYYKAGHAAIILIDAEKLKCHYFDFGRYHAPFQHGRVRSHDSDSELEINTIPDIVENRLVNFREILDELQLNSACHGDGDLHASYAPINFNKAYKHAINLQNRVFIPYGPFKFNGSNCSRFVNGTLLAGNLLITQQIKLRYFVPLTPTPLNNVKSLFNQTIVPKYVDETTLFPQTKLSNNLLKSTRPQPERVISVPSNAQWLSGEGAGSWYIFSQENNLLKVVKRSPLGLIESIQLYENNEFSHMLDKIELFEITYPINCRLATIKIKDAEIQFFNKTL